MGEISDWNLALRQTYELAEECVEINFFGAERVTEALIPLLQLSTSPRIVNVSSRRGKFKVKLFPHFSLSHMVLDTLLTR